MSVIYLFGRRTIHFMRLFKTSSDGLTEVCERGLDREGSIQDVIRDEIGRMVQNSIGCVFQGLVTLQDPKSQTANQYTVAFDVQKDVFVIIDYTSGTAAKARNNVLDHFTEMKNHKNKYVKLFNEIMDKQRKESDFNWDNTYAITMSPKQRDGVLDKVETNSSIHQYVVNLYHDGLLTIELLPSGRRP